MIHFPKTVDEAVVLATEHAGVYRAGGTDLQELRAHQAASERATLVDLRDLPGLDSVVSDSTGAFIGALTSLATIAEDEALRAGWPGVATTCGALATPQIRAIGTLGGNLVQAPRCWYYRHPDFTCLRQGGSTCYAREGDHLFHVVFDQGGCVAPHPSTAALALLAYDAEVELLEPGLVEPQRKPIAEVLGRGGLGTGALITTVILGPPVPGERSAYARASNRAYAEWALVEVCARVVLDAAGKVELARVTAGAVAPTPIRLEAVEAKLGGAEPTPEGLAAAAAVATEGAKPLPMTGYKLELLQSTVLEALEQALAAEPTSPPAPVESETHASEESP